ncbi:hypothetical protein BD289DRAFT_443110 [Coniella lustricola]|uniref:Uncharacterized protein n=1 Tax=Coniella lustricola TaxID=2025994 RepID=A0A2T2ZXG6_9PEZI|nr:hypothetical protein BD289DRAFT_443110 [Coniella lustricola]
MELKNICQLLVVQAHIGDRLCNDTALTPVHSLLPDAIQSDRVLIMMASSEGLIASSPNSINKQPKDRHSTTKFHAVHQCIIQSKTLASTSVAKNRVVSDSLPPNPWPSVAIFFTHLTKLCRDLIEGTFESSKVELMLEARSPNNQTPLPVLFA